MSRPTTLLFVFFAAWLGSVTALANADEFRLLAWNVESNRPGQPPVSNPLVIAEQLSELMRDPATRAEVVVLSEVDPVTVQRFQKAVAEGLGSEIDFVTSGSGGFQDTDSLMLIVDKQRFRIEEAVELHRYAGIAANFNNPETDSADFGALRARSPLAVRLVDLKSSDSFWVIANHLARGEAELRTDQARMLVKWAADRPEPVITAGDFNFDFEFKSARGNPGFQAMMEGGVWEWLKPDPLLDSNWSDDRQALPQRVDRYPDSILDFVFVANGAKQWQGEADVVVRPGDFPDNDQTSDHRPTIARFKK
ncbi:MAG: endonuclease/exonuclease/phosphatase family protein [Planctomycetota bacterium]|nr:endonuclease/exonuclease/phosphatase family protein [Blastopirellula sp.]